MHGKFEWEDLHVPTLKFGTIEDLESPVERGFFVVPNNYVKEGWQCFI
jgi:hypothetical protein